jgi:hypothetical protein
VTQAQFALARILGRNALLASRFTAFASTARRVDILPECRPASIHQVDSRWHYFFRDRKSRRSAIGLAALQKGIETTLGIRLATQGSVRLSLQ